MCQKLFRSFHLHFLWRLFKYKPFRRFFWTKKLRSLKCFLAHPVGAPANGLSTQKNVVRTLSSIIHTCIRSDVQWWMWNLLWIHNLSLINDYLLSCSSLLSLTLISTETDIAVISTGHSVFYWLHLTESLLASIQLEHLLGGHLNVRWNLTIEWFTFSAL
jgi:hypothetical protein